VRLPRPVRIALALALAAAALVSLGAGGAPGASPLEQQGRSLFVDGCSSCHGMDARGIPGRGPSLRGVGELSADFYLRTGRMPLAQPEDQPRRAPSPYSRHEIDALVAYVGSFGGPAIPRVDAASGDIARGFEVFGERCAGCHQIVARGGITTRGVVPGLEDSKPVDVAEAVHIGPYVMPHFRNLSGSDVASLARYVESTHDPVDRGGWGIGHVGPIPEGMVAWLLAAFALVLVIRLIGERTP
jgi:ubiquinol-cytochrome c reductase cytochrome c subunit